jgi:hypothetical protein
MGFWRHRALIVVAVAVAAVEAGLLWALAPAARPLAPQVTALAPLATFHDLRWLFGYHMSWLGFAAGLAGLLLLRSAVGTVLVRLAWPRDLAKPSVAATLRSNLALTALTVAVIWPVVALVFGVALLPFSWPFLPAVPAVIIIAALLSHGGVTSSWWRTLPPLTAVGWLLADFALLSAASAAIALLPAAAAVPVAGLAGLANARAWYGVTSAATRPRYLARHAPAGLSATGASPLAAGLRAAGGLRGLVRHPPPHGASRGAPLAVLATVLRRAPVAPLAAVMVLALTAGTAHELFAAGSTGSHADGQAAVTNPMTQPAPAGQAAGSALTATDGAAGTTAANAGAASTADPVLLIEGFGSSCCQLAQGLQQSEHGRLVQQFSYRGIDAAGQPLPHGRGASDLPLPLLGDRIADQVRQLHGQTGRPVDLVAESEGTLGVYSLLSRHPAAPIGSVVLASPIVAPGQASYTAGQRDGPGVASGYALRYMARFIGRLSPYGPSGAVTLINSVNSFGAQYQAAAARHTSIRWLAVIPLADALTLPACGLPGNVAVVTGFHGGLLGKANVQQMVRTFLAGQQVRGQQRFSDASQILAATGAGWRMPEIQLPSPPCPS